MKYESEVMDHDKIGCRHIGPVRLFAVFNQELFYGQKRLTRNETALDQTTGLRWVAWIVCEMNVDLALANREEAGGTDEPCHCKG